MGQKDRGVLDSRFCNNVIHVLVCEPINMFVFFCCCVLFSVQALALFCLIFFFSKNFIKINIYYEDLNYELIAEKPEIEVSECIYFYLR
jgi:hypothetical protein